MCLLSDAEGAEDEIEDVVGGGLAGEGVEGPEGAVEIEQDHLVRNGGAIGAEGVFERGTSGGDGLVLAEVGEQAGLGSCSAGGELEDLFAKSGDAVAGKSGGGYGGEEKLFGGGFVGVDDGLAL